MKKRKLGRKLLSFLLALAMVVGMLPGMSMTAYAAESTVTWDQTVFDTHPVGGTIDGITFTFESGMSAKYTFTAPETSTFTKIVFTANKNPSADSGQVSVENNNTSGDFFTKKATWTGNARSVVITVGSDGIGSAVFTLNTSDNITYTVEDDGSVSVGNMSTEEWSKLVDDNGNLTIDLSEVSGSNSVEIAASAAESMMSVLKVTDAGPGVMMWLKEESSGMTAWYGMDMPAPLLDEGVKLQINQLDLSDVSSSQGLSQAQAETLQGIKDALAIDISAAAQGIDFSELGDQKIEFYVNQPEEWDEAKTKGYYLREDGGIEEVPITFENKEIAAGTGRYAKMVLSHLSIYMLVQMADQDAPAKPTMASSTADSITLEAIANGEYRCDDGEWQTSPVFTGLSADTEYTFYQRLMGDAGHNASPSSEGAGFQVAHTHNDIIFTVWTSNDSLPTAAGSYYLANDVTLGSLWNVPEGTTNLCLNGHAIKASGSHGMISVGTGITLNLYDEGEGEHKYTINNGLAVVNDNATGEAVKTFTGGYITGGYVEGQGAAVLVSSGGIFHMYGGTLIGNKAYGGWASFGGAVSVQAGHFEMHDGKIIGNYSMYGAVDTRGGGDGFIMRGGEISYNTATYQGGGVCMGGSGIATISGGKITNNNALGYGEGHSEAGGIVFRSGASKLNISGNPIIKDNAKGDVYLWSGKKLTITGEIGQEASIGITIGSASGNSGYASGVFTNSADTSFNVSGSFFSNSSNYAVGKNSDGQLFLGSPIVTLTYDGNGATGGNVPAETTGYASGSAITVPGNTNSLVKTGLVFDGWNTMADGSGTAYAADQAFTITANTTLYAQWKIVHVHDDISFTAWTATNSMPTEAGNYYLANDVTISSTWNVPSGMTNLCLNGHGIIMNGTNRVITVASGRTLNLYDCGTEAVHKFTVTNPSDGGAGLATVNDSLESGYQTFTGGYITGGKAGQGGGVYVAGGTFNMAGGNIIGNKATASGYYDGGGVFLSAGSRFVMTGGAIQYNTSVGRGGGLGIVNDATVELSGDAKIAYNRSNNNDWGGGISSFGALSISGNVKITNNRGGSALHPQQGSLTISGAPVIFDNEVLANILTDVKINVAGTLTDGAKLGIYLGNGGVFTDSSDTTYNDASKFVSDNPDLSVVKGADGQLYLGYTVTFDAGGHGTAPDAQTVVPGSQLTKPTDPTAEGYTFDGWYKEEALTNEWDFESDTVTGNITLYAKWRQEISYIVTFKVVNGSWDDETTVDKTVTLTGYEGDMLKLAENQIPAVGSKPSATYKAGSWDAAPSADTAITGATTYTYTYVAKEASVVTKAPEAKTLTYNGSAQELVTAGEATGGEMQYSLGTATAATQPYTTSIPAKTDAGTYYVWYKVKADENHNDTDANYVEVSIGKRSVTLTSATASKVYDGIALTNTDVTVGGDGFVTGEGATYNVTGTQTLPGNSKNTFGYTLKTGTTAGNYEITKTEGTLTVTDRTDEEGDDKKYEITVTANSNEFTYDGTEHSVSGFVQTAFTFNGVTYTVSGLTANVKGTDAGSYIAEVTGTAVVKDANDNNLTNQFIVNTSNGTLAINKRNVTLTSATASKTYDGNALTDNTVTTSGDGFATGEGATYNVTGSQKVVGSSANAFAYTLNEGTKEANYNITKTEGTLTVTSRDAKYQISPQANSDELKYDGQSHEVTGFETDTFTVEGNTYTVSGLTAAGSGTDAGSHTVSVSGTAVVKDSDGNDVSDEFAVTPQTGTLTINKRSVTLTSASDEKEYDGDALTNDEVTVTGDGFITGEGADYDVTGTRTLVGSSENAFTYTLNEGTKADNYDITPSYGTLTVTNRNTKYEVTLKANSGTEKYDGSEKTVSGYTIDGTAGEGTGESVVTSFTASNGKTYTVTGMSAEVTGTNAGEYVVNVIGTPIVKDADGNDVTAQFAVSGESGKLTIDKRRVTLTSATDTKVYDGKALSNDEITVSEDGFAEGEGATYDVTGSQTLAGESANAFTYALSDGTIADNYDITTVEGKLTVTKSDSSGEVTAVSGLVYDGKAKALVTAGKTEGGTLMYRLGADGKWQQDIPEATDAGTYKIYYYIKGDDNHKDDGSEKEPKGSVETTIKKAAQDKPVETFAVAEASDDKTADGKISGFDKTKTYQYSADDGKTWTDVKTGSTEIAVKSGTYQIRYAEDKNHEAGKAASVTVTAKAAPSPEPKITYSNTAGAGSVWTLGSTGTLSFTFSRSENDSETIKHFAGAKVDGKELGSNEYSFKPGSVVIDLKADYLNKLSVGKHTLTAMFDDGDDVTVEFTIKEKASEGGKKSDTTPDNKKSDATSGNKNAAKNDAPGTGDTVNIQLIFLVMILSMCDIFALCNLRRILEKKKRRR